MLNNLYNATLVWQAIWQGLSGHRTSAEGRRTFRRTVKDALGPQFPRHNDDMLLAYHNARYDTRNDPELNNITVYQRHDRSRAGNLQCGNTAPNPFVLTVDGKRTRLLACVSLPTACVPPPTPRARSLLTHTLPTHSLFCLCLFLFSPVLLRLPVSLLAVCPTRV